MDPELVKKVQLLIGKHQESVNVKIVKEGFKCENISKMWMGKSLKSIPSFVCSYSHICLALCMTAWAGGTKKAMGK